jgi:hypothetical protein
MRHNLIGVAKTRQVYLNGELLDPQESQKYRNHSPDGFNWGYAGSGPAQLALAIMLKATKKPDAYQDLKFRVIAALQQNKDFNIDFYIDSPEDKARNEAIRNANAFNKHASKEYLSNLSDSELICWVHPLERVEIAKKLGLHVM